MMALVCAPSGHLPAGLILSFRANTPVPQTEESLAEPSSANN